jgi:hypothetical protein
MWGAGRWRIVPLKADSGQISNVSAFVLPEPMPVADHEQQLPMFGPERLLRLLEDIQETQRETARTQRLLAQQLNGRAPSTDAEHPVSRGHVPQNKDYRDWAGFSRHLQEIERSIRRDHHLRPEDEVSREMVYAAGGPSPRTLKRIMEKTYGLKPEQWPPSSWPKEPPTAP